MDDSAVAVLEAVARRVDQDDYVLPVLRLIADPDAVPAAADPGSSALAVRVNAARLAARRERFRSHALGTAAVRQLLGGISRQAVAQRVARHRLLASEIAGRMYFPDWQFGPDGVQPGIDRIVAVLHADGRSALQADAVMRTPIPEADGRSPAELVSAGRVDDALHFVTTAGEAT